MAAGSNIVVTSTVNRVTFEVDGGSYSKALKKMRSLKGEWEKTGQVLNNSKTSPSAAFVTAAAQMKLVNKRLEETRRREAKRTSDYNTVLAKKEQAQQARHAAISNARIRQTVGQLTATSPESRDMRKFYADMEKASKKNPNMFWKSTRPYVAGNGGLQPPEDSSSGSGAGKIGAKNWDQYMEDIKRRAAALNKPKVPEVDEKAVAKAAAAAARARANAAAREQRRQDIIGQQDIRLRSRHGAGYAGALGGGAIGQLNKDFAAGAISVGNYRAQIAALERQYRSAQSGALSFGDGLKSLRSSLVGVTAAYGAFNSGKSILEAGMFMQGFSAQMTMVSDSSQIAGEKMKFVQDQSFRLGLDLKTAAQGYTQMSVAAQGVISATDNDKLFKGFSEYATALNVDPVKYQRGITALGQMLGKGTIMSEELKGQLAEGIPGAMQAFVKAAQKYFKDDKIGVPELMKLMQEGKLLAKDILPYVGDEFSKAANKNGALDQSLAGTRVAMQRLGQTWFYWQNKIFEGGFGQKMAEVFNGLAHVLDVNGALATAIGEFFSGVIQGAWDVASGVYDAFVFLTRSLGFILDKLGVQADTAKTIFDWAAWTIGAGLFLTTVSRIFGVLSKIVGLRGALSTVLKMGGAAAAGGTGAAAAGAAEASSLGLLAGGSYLGPALLGGYAISNMNDATQSADGLGLLDSLRARMRAGGWAGFENQKANNPNWQRDLLNSPSPMLSALMGQGIDQNTTDLNYLMTQGTLAPFNAGGGWQDNRPQQAEITVKIDAGELQKIVDVAVDQNTFRTINLLTQGGGY